MNPTRRPLPSPSLLRHLRREIGQDRAHVAVDPRAELRPCRHLLDVMFHQVAGAGEVACHHRLDDLAMFAGAAIGRVRAAIHRHHQRAARHDLGQVAFQKRVPGQAGQIQVELTGKPDRLGVAFRGQPALLQTSSGLCLSAEQIPQGPPNVATTQLRARGT